jgi:4'-phosphopantetheinyl transferase EntD
LLRQLVGTEAAITARADRAPVLPSGVVASLAHTASIAVAVVAAAGSFVALGVDLEVASALDDDIGRIVLRPDEAGIDVALAFTLKEAAYKAWSGLGGRLLEHHDVRLVLGPDDRFEVVEVASATVLGGRHANVAGHHLAVVAVPTGQPAATSS